MDKTTLPFGLPEGTVRAALVAVLLLTACWLWVTKGALPADLSDILKWGLGGYAAIRTVAGLTVKPLVAGLSAVTPPANPQPPAL